LSASEFQLKKEALGSDIAIIPQLSDECYLSAANLFAIQIQIDEVNPAGAPSIFFISAIPVSELLAGIFGIE